MWISFAVRAPLRRVRDVPEPLAPGDLDGRARLARATARSSAARRASTRTGTTITTAGSTMPERDDELRSRRDRAPLGRRHRAAARGARRRAARGRPRTRPPSRRASPTRASRSCPPARCGRSSVDWPPPQPVRQRIRRPGSARRKYIRPRYFLRARSGKPGGLTTPASSGAPHGAPERRSVLRERQRGREDLLAEAQVDHGLAAIRPDGANGAAERGDPFVIAGLVAEVHADTARLVGGRVRDRRAV